MTTRLWTLISITMMTSSNGKIFRVTGPLCGEFTGPGEFPTQRPVTRSFDVFFDLRLNKRLSKQPWGWWFETPSWSLWRHRNDFVKCKLPKIHVMYERIFTVLKCPEWCCPKGVRRHDDAIKWKHFPRNWPFVRGIHRWPLNSPHKG